MEWTELTPLSITNLNDLETRIANADTAVVTGKQNIYNAILAYGQTPTSQTFSDLVAAINAIPIRAGDTAALASSISGTTLKLRASAGWRDGVDDNVTINDADFIAANILDGKDIFGLTGTAIDGSAMKRYATGSGMTASNHAIVSGLSFNPRIVAIRQPSGPYLYVFFPTYDPANCLLKNSNVFAGSITTGGFDVVVAGLSSPNAFDWWAWE